MVPKNKARGQPTRPCLDLAGFNSVMMTPVMAAAHGQGVDTLDVVDERDIRLHVLPPLCRLIFGSNLFFKGLMKPFLNSLSYMVRDPFGQFRDIAGLQGCVCLSANRGHGAPGL